MQLVERHIKINYPSLDRLCFLSKNLYNYVNYILRQAYLNKSENIPEYKDLIKSFILKDGKICYEIKEYDLTTRLAKLNQVDYRALPAQTSQNIVKIVYMNWKSFFKSLKSFAKDKSKFKGNPKLPHYKDKTEGRNIVIFTNQSCFLKDNFIYFQKSASLNPLKTRVDNICQVRIIPQATCYVIEVVYEKEIQDLNLNKDAYVSIDLGINNLATLTNNVGLKPFIVNGKIIKSINQFYNEKKAKLQSYTDKYMTKRLKKTIHSRNMKISDYLHKTSRFIIDYCTQNNIGNIVIGYNENWKQEVNLGKVTNQKFCNIPYDKLVKMIEYKAKLVGIKVTLNEESYSSKCDSLALEPVQKQNVYLGKRLKRGLFQSSVGKLVNADVNGSLNILRKVIGDDFVRNLINKSCMLQPVRVNCNEILKGI